jgi:hypothetical protein
LSILIAGGFENVLRLSQLTTLEIDGFWAAFEDIPPKLCRATFEDIPPKFCKTYTMTTSKRSLQEKLAYLRERLEASAEPLL